MLVVQRNSSAEPGCSQRRILDRDFRWKSPPKRESTAVFVGRVGVFVHFISAKYRRTQDFTMVGPIPQTPQAEAFSRPTAQPVSTQRCVRVCVSALRPRNDLYCVEWGVKLYSLTVYRHKAEVSAYACAYACVVSSLCPIYFSSPATLRLLSTTLAILSQPTYTGRKSVDQ